MEAFLDDFKTVDPRYLNFTASRLVGEAKNKDLAAGVEQVQRYARGLKRAQPWVHYVLAMTITRDKVVFMRGEGSGTERLELILSDGRGCIEFIRTLLGLALAEDVDLGQNPDVEVGNETRTREIKSVAHRSIPSNAPSSATASYAPRTANVESIAVSFPKVAIHKAASDALPMSSCTRSASAASKALPVSSRTRGASVSSKVFPSSSRTRDALPARRQHPNVASSASSKRVTPRLGMMVVKKDQRNARLPKPSSRKRSGWSSSPYACTVTRVWGYCLRPAQFVDGERRCSVCLILTTRNRQAFKMSWQDLERVADQIAVMQRLKDNPHANVIVPLEYVVSSDLEIVY